MAFEEPLRFRHDAIDTKNSSFQLAKTLNFRYLTQYGNLWMPGNFLTNTSMNLEDLSQSCQDFEKK